MRTTLLNTLKSKIVDQMSRLGRKKKSYIFGMIASFMMFGSLQGNAQCVISLDTAPTITIGTDPDNVCSVNYTLNDATLSGCLNTTTISVDVDGVGALFGQGFNFAVGTYTVTYTENEGSTSVTQTLIVEDDDAPIVTGCPADQTGVTNADGTGDCLATVTWAPPSVSDNCPGVTLSLSVVDKDGNAVAGAAVGGQYSVDLSPYSATYTATDVEGNTNTDCTFSITVSDNEDPVVTCPTDVTGLSCGEDIPTTFNVSNGTDFAALTGASLSDNCDATSDLDVSYSDSGSQTSCAGGTITRTYTITDDASNAVTCQMTFTWDADTTAPAVTGTITDSTVVGCTASDAPDAETTVAGLEGLTGDLMIEDDCTADGDLVVSSSDASAAGTGSVLVVVTRTYTVKDACDNSSVDIVHTINVEADDSGLAIVAPNDISIEACQADDMTVTAGNAGFAYSETSVTLTSGDVTTFLALAGASITGPCEYTVTYIDSKTGTCPEVVTRTYTVTDSGSSLTDSQTITVEDTTAPVVTGTIDDSSVEGCDASDAPAETTVAGLENLDGTLTIADVCTADGALTVTSSDESTGTCPLVITRTYVVADACGNTTAGIVHTITVDDTVAPIFTNPPTDITVETEVNETVANVEIIAEVDETCNFSTSYVIVYGDESEFEGDGSDASGDYPEGEHIVTFTATDDCGNSSTLIVMVTVNTPPNIATIEGSIYTESFEEVNSVQIGLTGIDAFYQTTEENGEYAFSDIPMGHDYIVYPYKNDNHKNGLTTLDLVLIQRHILGLGDLDSPYKMIAADINNSQSISSIDLVILRKIILGIYDDFPNNRSWRFIDAQYNFLDATDPWLGSVPEDYEITHLDSDMKIDFIGVKTGDVNESAIANVQSKSSETRSDNKWLLSISDKFVKKDENVVLEVKAENISKVYGWQYTLESKDLSFIAIESASANLSNQNIRRENSNLHMSYGHAVGLELEPNDIIYTMIFKATRSGKLSDMLNISNRGLTAESYHKNLEINNVEIRWNESVEESDLTQGFSVAQNEPNPWNERTSVDYYIPTAGDVKIVIKDVRGRVLFKSASYKESGNHTQDIEDSFLDGNGVLVYEVHYSGKLISNRMIHIR